MAALIIGHRPQNSGCLKDSFPQTPGIFLSAYTTCIGGGASVWAGAGNMHISELEAPYLRRFGVQRFGGSGSGFQRLGFRGFGLKALGV